ncbi:hypothetical protein PoB_007008000 [Plakobranchus ocellatus]|uniref:Uncharacterized protein n=1 Tax=Plakobranchus ocellatus TaxID=259542 RepID=A0AAV4DHS1_9GAST|nr:hypothetical protein PoB_007008000 [Plakobranchus ocellatus]
MSTPFPSLCQVRMSSAVASRADQHWCITTCQTLSPYEMNFMPSSYFTDKRTEENSSRDTTQAVTTVRTHSLVIAGPYQELQKGGVSLEGRGIKGGGGSLALPNGGTWGQCPRLKVDEFLQFESENVASSGTKIVLNQHQQVHNFCRAGVPEPLEPPPLGSDPVICVRSI